MIAPICIILKICFQKIGEEKDLQDNEYDKKLDQNDQPDLLPPTGKIGKTFDIKSGDLF